MVGAIRRPHHMQTTDRIVNVDSLLGGRNSQTLKVLQPKREIDWSPLSPFEATYSLSLNRRLLSSKKPKYELNYYIIIAVVSPKTLLFVYLIPFFWLDPSLIYCFNFDCNCADFGNRTITLWSFKFPKMAISSDQATSICSHW